MAMGKSFRVYEKSKLANPYSVILEHRNYQQTLLFESQAVAELTTLEMESLKSEYNKLLEAYGCLGTLQFTYGENAYLYLVMVTGCCSVGKIYDSEIFRITQTNFIPLHLEHSNIEDRIAEVRKVLNSGTFYFSWSGSPQHVLDITLNVQKGYLSDCTDNKFFWNRKLHVHLLRFGINTNIWLLKTMCGSIEIRTVYVGHRQARAVVISRLSCERAGTRFNVRGTNDDGHVANFVETEQIIYLDNEVSSYLQTRGSVPLFWEQPGIQVGSHKIKISRGFEASAPAFDRHLSLLKDRYGFQVIVNLLGSNVIGSKEGEAMLSQLFQSHHLRSQHSDIPHILFDYHQECRSANSKNLLKLKEKTLNYLEEFSFFYATGSQKLQTQKGTFRTNCLDCLDRTNCVQTFFALEILKKQLILLKLNEKQQIISRFEEVFRQMWINNGNEISKIYAGTGAIQGNSKLMDGARSAARTIQNNLLDSSKQEAIDILLLGSVLNTELADRSRLLLSPNILHAPPNVLQEMCKRYEEFTDVKSLKISVATYNVNGGKHFRSVVYKDVTLSDWLLDAPEKSLTPPSTKDESPVDIFAIGFEEIVDLNATNIVAASTDNTRAWAEELQKVLSRDNEYVLVTYQQLVGVCLYVYIRPIFTKFIKDVAVDCVKTGLGGATGNKGAVAIRFVLYSTSFCFVCAHFAAGQSQVTERNADYTEITKKILFPMGQTLNSHDYVFWCGDFNYRVDMDKDEMKDLIKKGDYNEILKYDQLKIQQEQGNVFENFLEGLITFAPTYKYDLFSDDYDTSEKCRQPAWTDRILWKRSKNIFHTVNDAKWNNGRLLSYCRSELKQSDHRPVIAIIEIDVHCINERKRKDIFKDVIQHLGPPDGTIIISTCHSHLSDPENIFNDNFMHSLVEDFSKIDEVILVRFVESTIWITFKNGKSALNAVKRGKVIINGYELLVKLKSPDWVSYIEKEINTFKNSESTTETQYCLNNSTETKIQSLNTLDNNYAIDMARKSPPPRPIPPNRQPELQNEQTSSTLPQIDSTILNDVNPPPLPTRQLPPPPQIPAPVLSVNSPPPIPARSSGGPPIPTRHIM